MSDRRQTLYAEEPDGARHETHARDGENEAEDTITIAHLPVELLLVIYEYLSADDKENFLLINQRIRGIIAIAEDRHQTAIVKIHPTDGLRPEDVSSLFLASDFALQRIEYLKGVTIEPDEYWAKNAVTGPVRSLDASQELSLQVFLLRLGRNNLKAFKFPATIGFQQRTVRLLLENQRCLTRFHYAFDVDTRSVSNMRTNFFCNSAVSAAQTEEDDSESVSIRCNLTGTETLQSSDVILDTSVGILTAQKDLITQLDISLNQTAENRRISSRSRRSGEPVTPETLASKDEIGAELVPENMRSMFPRLQRLILRRIIHLTKQCLLTPALFNQRNMRTLHLEGCKGSDEALLNVAPALGALTSLVLANSCRWATFKAISEHLKAVKNLYIQCWGVHESLGVCDLESLPNTVERFWIDVDVVPGAKVQPADMIQPGEMWLENVRELAISHDKDTPPLMQKSKALPHLPQLQALRVLNFNHSPRHDQEQKQNVISWVSRLFPIGHDGLLREEPALRVVSFGRWDQHPTMTGYTHFGKSKFKSGRKECLSSFLVSYRPEEDRGWSAVTGRVGIKDVWGFSPSLGFFLKVERVLSSG